MLARCCAAAARSCTLMVLSGANRDALVPTSPLHFGSPAAEGELACLRGTVLCSDAAHTPADVPADA